MKKPVSSTVGSMNLVEAVKCSKQWRVYFQYIRLREEYKTTLKRKNSSKYTGGTYNFSPCQAQ